MWRVRRGRALAAVTVIVALGAATTFVVAWILAASVPLPPPGLAVQTKRLPPDGYWYSHLAYSTQATGRLWLATFAPLLIVDGDPDPIEAAKSVEVMERSTPAWAMRRLEDSWRARGTRGYVEIHGSGWPMISHYSVTEPPNMPRDPVLAGVLHPGITLDWLREAHPLNSAQRPVVLPLRPVWRGFVINTALYSLVWWLSLFLPGRLHRRLRARRGLCARCGYDLKGQVTQGCPECGWGRAAALEPQRGAGV